MSKKSWNISMTLELLSGICHLAYSPHLNPIEEVFAKVKHYLRQNDSVLQAVRDPIAHSSGMLLGIIYIYIYIISNHICIYTAISIKVVHRAKRKSRIRARKAARNR
jgi:hypothetical protein